MHPFWIYTGVILGIIIMYLLIDCDDVKEAGF